MRRPPDKYFQTFTAKQVHWWLYNYSIDLPNRAVIPCRPSK